MLEDHKGSKDQQVSSQECKDIKGQLERKVKKVPKVLDCKVRKEDVVKTDAKEIVENVDVLGFKVFKVGKEKLEKPDRKDKAKLDFKDTKDTKAGKVSTVRKEPGSKVFKERWVVLVTKAVKDLEATKDPRAGKAGKEMLEKPACKAGKVFKEKASKDFKAGKDFRAIKATKDIKGGKAFKEMEFKVHKAHLESNLLTQKQQQQRKLPSTLTL